MVDSYADSHLNRDNVGGSLQHLNSQQPTILFTMETEKDNAIPLIRWLQEMQMATSLPVFTESLSTLTSTLHMIHTTLNQ